MLHEPVWSYMILCFGEASVVVVCVDRVLVIRKMRGRRLACDLLGGVRVVE